MIYTNHENHGKDFFTIVDKALSKKSKIDIASGYISYDMLDNFQQKMIAVSNKSDSRFRLMVGMAFYEGLTQKNYDKLIAINTELNRANGSGVFVCWSNKYHGKVYDLDDRIYVGSSNFSRSGLKSNYECTASIEDEENKAYIKSFLNELFNPNNAVSIDKAEITIIGSKKYQEIKSKKVNLDRLPRHQKSLDISLPSFEYPLELATTLKSNLNVYFGKGRLQRNSGKVTPRPWYEVELIAPNEINQNPLYPQGDFLAYTDDGYIIPMKTSGDYFKNIRSKNSLQILGEWIKGKLQEKGALQVFELVTKETFERYGKDKITFYKIDEAKYYVKF
jgi:HKD family nuclease